VLVLAVKVVAAAAQSAFQSVPWVLRTTKVLLQGKAATASAAGAGDPPSYYQIHIEQNEDFFLCFLH